MKRKPYDYIKALYNDGPDDCAFAYPADAKRILRKLARDAMQKYWDEWGGESHEGAVKRIAKELIP